MSALAELLAEAQAAGIRFTVKEPGKVEMRARKEPPPELVAKIRAAKPALLVVLGAVIPEIPQDWTVGATRLRAMPLPRSVSATEWSGLLNATERFIGEGWASKAAALGWSALDVWGCHPNRPVQRLDLAGAAWLIGADEIAGIAPTTIALRRPRAASPLTIYRHRWPAGGPVIAAWELPT